MDKELKILLLEDNEDDANLIEYNLKKTGLLFTSKRVDAKSEYIDAFNEFSPDLVLSDHSLPQFNSIEALAIAKSINPYLPFILVTGTVSEEFAVDCIKQGANDYVLKGNLTRLSSAITNALKQKKAEIDKNAAQEVLRKSEEHFRNLIENSSDIFGFIDKDKIIQYMSPSVERVLGYTTDNLLYRSAFDFIHPDDVEKVIANYNSSELAVTEFRFRHKKGPWRYLECISKPVLSGDLFINIRDITERKLNEEEVRNKNIELEKINKELDSFVYSASHDLRAPLKSILGLIKISDLEIQHGNYDGYKTYTGMMEKSIHKLDETIHGIINYSMNSKSNIAKDKIDFGALINEVFENMRHLEQNDAIKKIITIEEDWPFVSDKNRVTIIFNNLISNAIKFYNVNDPSPFIKINIKNTSQKAIISIEDNGIGIHKEYMGNIFDMFFRATEKSDGSGLGLYIVKEVVNKLNGSIKVESEINKGSIFTIELPIIYIDNK